MAHTMKCLRMIWRFGDCGSEDIATAFALLHVNIVIISHDTVTSVVESEEVGHDMHIRHGHMTLLCTSFSRMHIRAHKNVICESSWLLECLRV